MPDDLVSDEELARMESVVETREVWAIVSHHARRLIATIRHWKAEAERLEANVDELRRKCLALEKEAWK